ncbi:hypothetical protein TST_1339 [Thermosulfidibacter takaii ABI70S6]|uniref:GTP cyclohydrolase FolE2 n=1 Tax=Thermosulfidibacter takaii (strain DSM 17441 / JCM 13301 / NBRC 103674 / ABI70S6) TaxID=1298851 RepID=A0A0S3QUX0_THET7|nr:GTP cyclohydrolase FolE2 [Thermosulfidibacter takaii]BAT72126.1 hypothetical protein TST_1339 [Thermosulfidibacter takaii ABI70S6]
MRDLQNERDYRNIPIDRVGIKGLKYPITVLDRHHKEQPTVAEIDIAVGLPKEFRGTHMSRFVEILNNYRWKIHTARVLEILNKVMEKLPSHSAYLRINFPYFLEKQAPVSKEESLMNYNVSMEATLYENGKKEMLLTVEVPVMTLCPCSKEISDKNAHNQRALVKISVKMNKLVWIEELIETAESCASAQLYSLLKREDEKYITEYAYEHPVFVEDLVRDIALKLKKDERISWFRIEAESMESIHNHNAFAVVEAKNR